MLVLDDIHWADPASVELLGSLLRSPPDAAVLIVVAIRPRQAPERLSAALERARRAGTLTRLELGALTRAEAAELLDAAIDEQSPQRCTTRAAVTRSTWSSWPGRSSAEPTLGPAAADVRLADSEVPPLVATALARGDRAASG